MKTDWKTNYQLRITNYELFRISSFFFAVKSLFVLLLLFSNAAPQEISPAQNFHQWGAVTLFNGLPSDNVRAIAQTADGVLWFGTDNGLAKFDGRRVQTVALAADANKILALEIAPDGTLWIGTGGGAFFYEENRFQKIEETKNIHVTSILFAETIYLASGDGLIFKLRENADHSFQVEKIPATAALAGSDGQPLKITSLAQIDGKIVAGTRSRSILLVEDNRTFETFSRPRPFFVNALAQDRQGNVWLGADAEKNESGFFLLPGIGNFQRIGENVGNVLAIEPDASGGAWVGTQANGLFHFRAGQLPEHFTFENTAGGLRSNTVETLFLDRENVIWIGTNRGACRFDAASPFNQTVSDNRNGNFVRTIFRTSSGQTFAGTNRGLYVASENIWLEVPNFSSKVIYAAAESRTFGVVLATPNGILSLDGKQILAGDARAAADFQGKTYAAVFGRGVVQIENQTPIFAQDAPTALFADHEKLWIGTARDGVFSFDGKTTQPEKSFENLKGAAIWKIKKGGENDLWLAGERGLFLFQNGNLQEIIANADVRDAVVNRADVWAATLKSGLFHVRFDKDFGWIKSAINVEQGLPSEQIFSILSIDNRLLVGTNRGVVGYVPNHVAPQIIPTRVLSQRLYNADELNDLIKLDYPQNSLLLEVAGLSSRTFPEQFQYGFTLKNKSGEILDKKLSNEAQFTPANLSSGEYSVEALAFNKDLLASEPLIIRFSVARAPFPWTATWLGVLLAIAVVGLIWATVERRRIRQKNRELAAARFDLASEAERERRRIARDLHDQTLADLRSLMLMSDELPFQTDDFRREIESVSTEIRRICEDLSPSVLENVGLAAALEFLLQHTTRNYKFTAAENLEENINFSPNVQMQIYRIAQEVLNNIKRHSDAEFVEMKIEISAEKEFILSIEDDGKYFNAEEITRAGRGVKNIKSRAALVEAEIFWQARDAGGTIFRLKR